VSRREDVDTAFWRDPEVRALPADARYVYLWLFTNDGQNLAGVYMLDIETVVLETGKSRRVVEKALGDLEREGHIVRHRHLIWVRSRVKKLGSRNPSSAKRIARIVDDLDPANPIRDLFLEKYACVKWLREALSSIDVETVIPKAKGDTLSRQVVRAGAGAGAGAGSSTSTNTENSKDYSREFDAWLADHEQVTGMRPPGERTKARAAILKSFTARRREDYSLDDLKLATRGAFADEHRRTNGYFGCLSVLRPQKVHDLVEQGRRAAAGPLGAAPTAADRGVTDMLEAGRRLREEDAA